MYRLVTVLILSCSVFTVYTQTTGPDPSVGIGTDHCKMCGSKSDIDLEANGLTAADISRCALKDLNGGTDLAGATFQCECKEPFYEGNGITCNSADECEDETDNCDNHATCTDTVKGFECDCKEGWIGDGVICSDFNECGNQTYVAEHNHTHGPCGDSGKCFNTVGSYKCVCYPDQYIQVDGTNNTECEDINECDEGYNCTSAGANRVCNNLPGSVECICDKGFEEINGECKDIDECERGTDECDRNLARCKNLIGDYECMCVYGYSGNGKKGNCAVMGGDLVEKGKNLERVQAVIRVHMLENQRQQLENEHEMLLRRCDQQDQMSNRIVKRARREILQVSEAEAANAELWIATLTSHISDLKLQNHVLELSCPEN